MSRFDIFFSPSFYLWVAVLSSEVAVQVAAILVTATRLIPCLPRGSDYSVAEGSSSHGFIITITLFICRFISALNFLFFS
nr:MAG TPA: hypothetical protein [Caudoviricetes sp.]